MYRRTILLGLLGTATFVLAPAVGTAADTEATVIAALKKAGVNVQIDKKSPNQRVIGVYFNTATARNLYDEDLAKFAPGLAHFKSLRVLNFGDRKISDSTLGLVVKSVPYVRSLGLYQSNVTDEGLKMMEGMKYLEVLYLNHCDVTDEGMKTIATIESLTHLDLESTKVSDAGMTTIKGLPKLEELTISKTAVTDAGLRELKAMKSLKRVFVTKSKITKGGVDDLRKALPEILVYGP
jgi:internalin A